MNTVYKDFCSLPNALYSAGTAPLLSALCSLRFGNRSLRFARHVVPARKFVVARTSLRSFSHTNFALCSLLFALYALPCNASSAFLSQDGQIQNVQSYSTNPYWNPDSPYNQRPFPTVVNLKGPDLDSGDCQSIVSALVASYCAANNNCLGLDITTVRPTLMVQLSSIPNHNYTTCSAYIDNEFTAYKASHATAAPTGTPTAFPSATRAVAATGTNTTPQIVITNKLNSAKKPEWKQEADERTAILNAAQAQNNANNGHIEAAAFPTTFADLSFTQRNEIMKKGYEPYKDAVAYRTLKLESVEEYEDRMLKRDKKNMDTCEFCSKHPGDSTCTDDVKFGCCTAAGGTKAKCCNLYVNAKKCEEKQESSGGSYTDPNCWFNVSPSPLCLKQDETKSINVSNAGGSCIVTISNNPNTSIVTFNTTKNDKGNITKVNITGKTIGNTSITLKQTGCKDCSSNQNETVKIYVTADGKCPAGAQQDDDETTPDPNKRKFKKRIPKK